MSDLIFQIFVSFVVFLFVCCLQYRPEQPSTITEVSKNKTKTTQPIIPLLPPVKQRLHNTTEVITNDVIIPPFHSAIAYLPPVKVSHQNQTTPIINPTLITEAPKSNKPQISPNITLKALKEYIKEHNLQTLIYEKLGKSYSKAKKEELFKALNS
ncbi:hypothetical protein PCC7424_5418 (plasmid) [Gloeothece citriformis PCC 7424]|uniref:Uncharacterized protein n=1 Tax=Gloeothece citriformis (strain PCC 7424) TaxID=65393 RepID=B7KMH1_GLOC7|nr:hypothetical protein [Gloeothece citriformis]ACK73993.1 hypothetical protein PCC7424_5418 [Gloeothece citriformis PCC 7424]